MTYIRTQTVNREDRSLPYCSASCANSHGQHIMAAWRGFVVEIPGYEFAETCTNCGKLIPASA